MKNMTTNESSWATKTKKKGFDGIIVVIGLVLLVLVILLVFQGKANTTMNNFMDEMDTKIKALGQSVGANTTTYGNTQQNQGNNNTNP